MSERNSSSDSGVETGEVLGIAGRQRAVVWCQCPRIGGLVAEQLRGAKWQVAAAADVGAALEMTQRQRPELLVICFVGQPTVHAGRVAQKLRAACPRRDLVTVGLVEPRQVQELDPTWGLTTFVIHPYQPQELLARIRLACWQHGDSAAGLIKAGPLVINPRHYLVTVDGRPVDLTSKEYELLRLLVEGRGRVFTRPAALRSVWGDDYYGGERTVDVHIRRLRAKLPEIADRIETVRGVGYRFAAR